MGLKISIITVCYNIIDSGRKQYFKQMLDSVKEQSYDNIEHIIIDGASSDGSVEYIKHLIKDDQRTVFVSEPDTGIYDAMNKGWRLATGAYVAYLNSDDFYHDSQGIEFVANALEKKPVDYLSLSVKVLKLTGESYDRKYELEKFLIQMPFCHQGFFVKKSLLEADKGFDASLFQLAGDYDFILRLLLRKDVEGLMVSRCFATFREGGFSADETLIYSEYAKAYKKNYSRYLAHYKDQDWLNLAKKKKIPWILFFRLRHCFSLRHYAWFLKLYSLGR